MGIVTAGVVPASILVTGKRPKWLRDWARFARAAAFETLPEPVVDRTRLVILDCMGAMIAGRLCILQRCHWIALALKYPRWDFANSPYPPVKCTDVKELLARYEYSINEALNAIADSKDDILEEPWSMGMGDITYLSMPRWFAVRHAFGQNAHHRAQLQVCLRLLNIPVPGPYGPSAYEMGG